MTIDTGVSYGPSFMEYVCEEVLIELEVAMKEIPEELNTFEERCLSFNKIVSYIRTDVFQSYPLFLLKKRRGIQPDMLMLRPLLLSFRA